MPELLRDLAPPRKFVTGSDQISYMDRYPIGNRTAGNPPPLERAPYAQFDWDDPMMCFHQQVITVPQQNRHVIGNAKAAGNARDGLQHRLKIEFRSADDCQHLTDRSLILQRFREFVGTFGDLACARLLGLEETAVLDRDHRLIRERRHQLDLLGGKWLRLP